MATFLLITQYWSDTSLFLSKLSFPSPSFSPLLSYAPAPYIFSSAFFLLFSLSHLPHPLGIISLYLLSFGFDQHYFCFMQNRFYLLYFITYIPTLILTVSNNFVKSGTEVEHRNQYMHSKQTIRTIHCKYLLLKQVLVHSLEQGEVSS